jgi:predicted DNA-binding antitoxin AbrB/MazE fold protein
MSVRAVYENGVFKPATPVDLPERSEVEIEILSSKGATQPSHNAESTATVSEILSRRYRTGHVDAADRHDEHQP